MARGSKMGRKEAKTAKKVIRKKSGGKIGGKAIKTASYKRYSGYTKRSRKAKTFGL